MRLKNADVAASLDVAAIGAHPDDIEYGCGGILLLAKEMSLRTGAVVLTRGEAGDHGTLTVRTAEARDAAALLQLDEFSLWDYRDALLSATDETTLLLTRWLKQRRPHLVLAPHPADRHPDHLAAADLARRAVFLAARAKILPELPAIPPVQIWWYALDATVGPSPVLLVDISMVWERKIGALKAHVSQYETNLASRTTTDRYLGSLAGVQAAEGFIPDGPLVLSRELQLTWLTRLTVRPKGG